MSGKTLAELLPEGSFDRVEADRLYAEYQRDDMDGTVANRRPVGSARRTREQMEAVATATGTAAAGYPALLATVEKLTAGGTAAGKGDRLTDAQVCKRWNFSPSSLARLVENAAKVGIARVPWVIAGEGEQRDHRRWDPEKIDNFISEVEAWRSSTRKRGPVNTSSGGARSAANSAGAPARRSKPRTSSSTTSSTRTNSATSGSLRTLAERLILKKK